MKDQNYGKVVTVPKEYVDRTDGDIVRHYSKMMARDLCDKVLTEMVKGECICSLSPMFQTEIPEEHLVEMRQKVTIRRLVRCKDCRWKDQFDVSNYGPVMYCRISGRDIDENGFCERADPKEGNDAWQAL